MFYCSTVVEVESLRAVETTRRKGNAIPAPFKRCNLQTSGETTFRAAESNSSVFLPLLFFRECNPRVKSRGKCLTIRSAASSRASRTGPVWPWHLVIINARSINFAPCFMSSTTNLLDHCRHGTANLRAFHRAFIKRGIYLEFR